MTEQELQRKLMILESQVKEMEFKVNRADSNTSQLQSLVRGHQFMIDENKRAIYGTVGGKGISIIRGADGAMEIIGSDVSYPKPFDISSVSSDSFNIENNLGRTLGFVLGGTPLTVGDGSIPTYDAGNDLWTFESITTEGYVYLLLDRSNATVEIDFSETSTPSGYDPDINEVYLLWYIAYDSGNSAISKSGIIDLRTTINETTFR